MEKLLQSKNSLLIVIFIREGRRIGFSNVTKYRLCCLDCVVSESYGPSDVTDNQRDEK